MSFTQAARNARRGMTQGALKERLLKMGWVEPLVPPRMLQELDIEHEYTGDKRNATWVRGGKGLYAPVWVYGVVDRAGACGELPLMTLLRATRDSPRDQRLLCAELIMDYSIPERVRAAAGNYIKVRFEETDDD